MKKLVFYLLVIFILIIIYQNIPLKSQNDCYINEQGCGEWVIFDKWITLSTFPNCSLYVNSKVRECPSGLQLYIEKIWYSTDDPDCEDLVNCIYPNWPSKSDINESCVRDIWKNAYNELSYGYFYVQTENWTDEQKDEYLCQEGEKKIIHSYFRNTCSFFCVSYIDENGNECGEEYKCDNLEGCCSITKTYCYIKIWNPVSSSYEYFPQVTTDIESTSILCRTRPLPEYSAHCIENPSDCYLVCDQE